MLAAGALLACLVPPATGGHRAEGAPGEPDYAFPASLLLPWPCGPDSLELTADWRSHKTLGFSLDFGGAAALGRIDVVAPGAGTVVEQGWSDEGYGLHIEIDVGHGWHVLLGHLAAVADGVHGGEEVAAGRVLGTLGDSGLAEEPHVHFELLPANGHAPDVERIRRIFGRDRDEFALGGARRQVPNPCPADPTRA
jgi:murein DD-endopeptidase MepM/ murein hydrolase activator NlpD